MKHKIGLLGLTLSLLSICIARQPDKDIHRDSSADRDESQAPPILIQDGVDQVILKTANGCGIGNFVIPSIGDSSQGIPPLLGSISEVGWPNFQYVVLDTIPGREIKGVAFTRYNWTGSTSVISSTLPTEPYVVVSDTGMFSYMFHWRFDPYEDTIFELSSKFIPGILKMARQITTTANIPIVLLEEDSITHYRIRCYSYPDLLELFSFPFQFVPEVFEVTNDEIYIAGWDTTSVFMLYRFSAMQDSLIATYSLNDLASNAKEFLRIGDSLYVLSSPGDSLIVLSKVNSLDSTLTQTTIYSQSGARATYNEYRSNPYFTFQPISDFPDSILDRQILILNPSTLHIDTLFVNNELDQFKNPEPQWQSFGLFSMDWIGVKWDGGINDSVLVSDYGGTSIYRLKTGAYPDYINATYGCWVGVSHDELKEIQFEVYPNPTSTEVVINLVGLIKGRKYEFTITDQTGAIQYSAELEPYQKFILPIKRLSRGVYFVNLNTGKNIITRSLIIQ